MPGELSGSIEQQRRQVNKTLMHLLRQICQDRVNGEFGSNRDANVYGDDAKSKIPRRLARALGWRSALRTAIQIGGEDRPRYRFRDCRPHFL
jgi:hypothetical protein